ncbi:hypothetical protein LCGC14_2081000 [marine sediment metagenome]|uniref:Uncharacterized protein n=1 Tax=marine sediment metagenome TaxID=412755 RepID=A0A0F9EFI6_9ZZZZ
MTAVDGAQQQQQQQHSNNNNNNTETGPVPTVKQEEQEEREEDEDEEDLVVGPCDGMVPGGKAWTTGDIAVFTLGATMTFFSCLLVFYACHIIFAPWPEQCEPARTALEELREIQRANFEYASKLAEDAKAHALEVAKLNTALWKAVARAHDESMRCAMDGRNNACEL